MKKLTITKGERLPLLLEVNEFEEKNCLSLHDSFIHFLITQNPIYVEESNFIVEGKEPFDITFFPFSCQSEDWTIQKGLENLFVEFLERKYLSFGCDSGGWQYVISVQEENYGKIYLCRMDEALEDALTFLAESFEDFINGLEKPSEELV